jgi:putative Holliday junction resolvase
MPPKSRIIALDFGMARIGVAMSDEQKIIATPILTITSEKRMQSTVTKLLSELKAHATANNYVIEEIVVGMPFLMSGKKGLLADEVLHFVEELKKSIDVPIATWDERLSSVQAERSLREGSLTRKRRSRIVDTVAATIILQSYLDNKRMSL